MNSKQNTEQFTINEIEAYEMVHLIRAVKIFMKKRVPIYMIDYLRKREIVDEDFEFKRGSKKYIDSLERKFCVLYKKATGKQLR